MLAAPKAKFFVNLLPSSLAVNQRSGLKTCGCGNWSSVRFIMGQTLQAFLGGFYVN